MSDPVKRADENSALSPTASETTTGAGVTSGTGLNTVGGSTTGGPLSGGLRADSVTTGNASLPPGMGGGKATVDAPVLENNAAPSDNDSLDATTAHIGTGTTGGVNAADLDNGAATDDRDAAPPTGSGMGSTGR